AGRNRRSAPPCPNCDRGGLRAQLRTASRRRRSRAVAAAGARAIGCALTPEITSFRRREWNPLPYEGCVGVDGKVVVHEDDLLVAMLRFGENATIHEHPGETETVVACIEGEGLTSVAGEKIGRASCRERVWRSGVGVSWRRNTEA